MRNPEQTREKILKKSGLLFNTQGYKATSISDITSATGFTKGAIYRHFKSKEELEKEKEDMLIGAFEDDQMLGCCLLTKVGTDAVRLRQMAVKAGLQGKGIGRVLMQFAENLARDRGYKKISMHARNNAVGFYEKMGYKKKGKPFEEITIAHYLMEKEL